MDSSRVFLKLGSACEKIGSGATPRGGKEVYLNAGISLIRSQNVYNLRFSKEGLAFIGRDHADELENVEVRENDVLLNITGDSVARACQVPVNVLPARVNQHVAIIRVNSKLLDAKYLCYYLVSPKMQKHMLSLAGAGATRNALTKSMIEDFQIPALSLPEQRAIARILSSLDDKIELNRRTNATLEELARGLFRSWFVDFAPVRAKAEGRAPTGMDAATAALFPDGFETVDGREVPRGWKIGVLDDIAFNKRDAIQPEEMPSDMPYIGLEHMPRRSIALSEWETASDLMSNKFRFQMGDILFGKLRPYFHKVGFSVIEGVCSTDILVLLPKEKIWYSYVLMCVSSDDLIIFATAASDGTKMPRTSWRDISRYNVVIPSNSIINMFNSKILSITEKIRSNIHESRTLAALRDALLPKLLSGELRVREVERVEA